MGRSWRVDWVRIATVDPIAHEVFLAWAREHGYENIEPAGTRQESYSWSVADSSPNEYLYGLHYPVEGGRTVRVFRQGDVWKAEEVHWQFSVGKPSWQEVVERLLQKDYLQGWRAKIIMEGDDSAVVALVWPENLTGSGYMYRFLKGDDGLWRGYETYDPAVKYTASIYRTLEDALIAFAFKNFPELPILGDCAQAQKTRDAGKVCWTLKKDTGDRRTYVIGPAFSEGEKVQMVRHEPGWRGLTYDRFPYP